MPKRTDEELVLAGGRGDQSAFGLVVERHHRTVIHFAYRFLGDVSRDTAEDLAQDAFLAAWKAAPSFTPRAKVITWLLRIATNICLNHRRRGRFRRTLSLDSDTETGDPRPHAASTDQAVTTEKTDAIRAALATLAPKQRAAIVLRHYHDFSYAEIAETLVVSISAVESLLFRARTKLKADLSSAGMHNSPQVFPELGAESV